MLNNIFEEVKPMEAVKIEEKEAVIACQHCDATFLVDINNMGKNWQHFVFECPKCNEMNCIPKCEIVK